MTGRATEFSLPEPLASQGERVSLGGESPVRLDAAEQSWILLRGQVELFLVGIDADGQISGVRHHLATLSPGALLMGMEADARGEMGLLAVAHPDTELLAVPPGALVAAARQPEQRPVVAALLDSWIAALHQGMARLVTPRPYVGASLLPGEPLEVASGERFSAEHGVVWLRLDGDNSLYLDTHDIGSSGETLSIPISADAWLTSLHPLAIDARSTEAALADGDGWDGVKRLHRLLFDTVRLDIRLANVDELNRLKARRAANDACRDDAFDALMRVSTGQVSRVVAAEHHDTPLVAALRLIGREEGFEIQVPASLPQDPSPSLEAIARASGLRLRAITLTQDWWRRDFGSLLAFDASTGTPLVLLFGIRSQPRLIDPQSGEEQPLAPERIAPAAWEMSAPLPFKPLRFRDLFRVARQRGWRDVVAMLLLSAIGALIGLATPVTTGYIIDRVLPSDDQALLMQLGVALVVLALTTFAVTYLSTLAFSRAETKVGRVLQSGIMDRVLRLPMSFFKQYSTGDLANRVMAMNAIQSLISTSAVQALLGGVFSIFSFALMFFYNVKLALWAALVTFVYVIASLVISILRLRRQRKLAELSGKLNNLLLQLILGVSKIRLAAAEERAFAQWASVFAEDRRHQLAASRLGAWQAALSQLLTLAGLLTFVLVIGKNDNATDLVAIGAFSALLVAYQRFASSLESVLGVATQLLSIQPQLERTRPLLDAAPEISDEQPDPGELSGAIEVAHLDFRYDPNGPLILRDLSLEAPAGRFIAIVGGSGSGKSTLMRLLLGFETPESGGIFFDGKDLAQVDVTAVRRQMGVVLQNGQVLPGSLYENIVGPSGGSLEQAWHAARQVGLADDIEQMPMGMQTLILEGGGALSGGQMQRLMIARAIVGRPKILILDEATSALDNRTQAVVTDSLDRLHVTRIIIAHRLSTIVKADKIYVMDKGTIVESGTYDELMAAKGLFADLARRQQ